MGFETWEKELPKTSTRKIKRNAVIEMMQPAEENNENQDSAVSREHPQAEDELTLKLKIIIAKLLKLEAKEIKAYSHLHNDLGVDSLMKIEMLCAIEKECNISIPDEAAYQLKNFSDVVRLVSECGNGKKDQVSTIEKETDKIITSCPLITITRFISLWFFRILSKTYFRLEVRGKENIPPIKSFIIASNHTSLIDFPVHFSSLPSAKMYDVFAPAAQDNFYLNSTRRFLVRMALNIFAFERGGNYVRGLKIASELIKRGKSIILFPEGTRLVEGKLLTFKPGVGSLASELKVPVIPAYIEGAFEVFRKGSFFPTPTKITVTFAQPVYAERFQKEAVWDPEKFSVIAAEVKNRIQAIKER